MNGSRVLYHMARADFLERTRRYSFLVLLGLAAWIGYVSASGQIIMRIYPNYTGEINSAWAGTLMSLTVTFFLGWFTGLLFIPSLALAAGVLTGSSKAFEVLYVLWMYLLIQKAPPFDFLGMTPQSPLAIYSLAAFALMVVTIFARWRQLKVR